MAILDEIEEWPVGQPGWNSMVKQILARANAIPEIALDALAQKMVAGSGIALNYNSATKVLTVSGTGAGGLDTEAMMDYIASNMTVGGLTGTYDGPAGTIDFPGGVGGSSIKEISAPSDHGLSGWTVHPDQAGTSTTPTAGVVHLVRCRAVESVNIGNLCTRVNAAGTGLSNCYVGLYGLDGTRLGVSADLSTAWNSTGEKINPLTSTVPVVAGTAYIAALLMGAGTALTLPRASASSMSNYGIALPQLRVATFGSGLTALPTSIDFSTAVNNTGLVQYWVGMKV
jgi:hypothetical protein